MTTDNKRSKPASPAEAEDLAKRAVQEYLNACRMTDRGQIGNYLMKLCSVASVLMAQADGSEIAGLSLEGTAAWVRKTMPTKPANLEKLQ